MNKKNIVLILILTMAICLSGCRETEKTETLTSESTIVKTEENKTETTNMSTIQEYKVGDTWEVDGLWKMTVTEVEKTDERNKNIKDKPAAVYIISYEYENIEFYGLEENDGLLLDLETGKITDSSDLPGYVYPAGTYKTYPKSIKMGKACKAKASIGVDNDSKKTKIHLTKFDETKIRHDAIFVLDKISEIPESEK